MKGIIVDDEAKSRTMLKTLCETYCQDIEIVGLAASVSDAIKLIQTTSPDIVFLDIQLPIQSGFSLLEYYGESPPFEVIFTTAYDQYALKAFSYSAIDYLLKPISIEELKKAVNKIKPIKAGSTKKEQLSLLKEAIVGKEINKIALTTVDGFTFVRFDEIVRCEAQGNYTDVFIDSKSSLLITKTLKHYEGILPASIFFRAHKSHLINLKYVRRFIRGKQGMVEMNDGKMIEVSLRKREALLIKLATLSH